MSGIGRERAVGPDRGPGRDRIRLALEHESVPVEVDHRGRRAPSGVGRHGDAHGAWIERRMEPNRYTGVDLRIAWPRVEIASAQGPDALDGQPSEDLPGRCARRNGDGTVKTVTLHHRHVPYPQPVVGAESITFGW